MLHLLASLIRSAMDFRSFRYSLHTLPRDGRLGGEARAARHRLHNLLITRRSHRPCPRSSSNPEAPTRLTDGAREHAADAQASFLVPDRSRLAETQATMMRGSFKTSRRAAMRLR